MSEREFECYLRLMSRFLRLSSAQRDAIARELRDHMEERLADLVAQGYDREDAIQAALDEFGDAAGLAHEFTAIRTAKRRRLVMRATVGTLAAAAVVILVVSSVLPPGAPTGPAPTVGQGAAPAASTAAPAPPAPAARPAEEDAEARLLGKPITVNFDSETLVQALQYVREETRTNFVVNWPALEAAGVDPQTTIRLRLINVPASKVLQLVLDQVVRDNAHLRYRAEDGIVQVSTAEDLDRQTVTRVYDVRDLIQRPLIADRVDLEHLLQATRRQPAGGSYGGGGGGGGVAMHGGPDAPTASLGGHPVETEPAPAPAPIPTGRPATTTPGGPVVVVADAAVFHAVTELQSDRAQRLVHLLQTIAPDTWTDNGGSIGSVREFDGLLIVRHAPHVHREIGTLLALVRDACQAPAGRR